jgi:hypothetical protein
LAYRLAGVLLGVSIFLAAVGIKARYSCGEGWGVSETSRDAAISACSAGDVPPPTIHTDLELGARALVLLVGFAVAAVPLRMGSDEGRTSRHHGPEDET